MRLPETLAEVEALDQDVILAGYQAGLGFTVVNHMQSDPGYWHGYSNGQVDRQLQPLDARQQRIAREFVERGRLS